MAHSALTVRPARFPEELSTIQSLFQQYRETPGVAECVVSFDEEVANLPGRYSAVQRGDLMLGLLNSEPVACGAYRQLEADVCEMKRLFVAPTARGSGAGRELVETLIQSAQSAGYRIMRLDTLPSMQAAIGLYRSLGFRQIGRYYPSAPEHALFFQLSL